MNKQLLKNSYHDKKHKWRSMGRQLDSSEKRHENYLLFLKNWNELSSEEKDKLTLKELHGYNFLSVSVVNSLRWKKISNFGEMRKIFFNNDNSYFVKNFENLGKTGVLQLNIFMYEFFYEEYKKSNKEIRLTREKTTKDIIYLK